jgi:hypothetical protein
MSTDPIQKITVHVPRDILAKARRHTGQGVTETVRQGLKLLAAADAYERLRSQRGRVRLRVDLDEVREDRD